MDASTTPLKLNLQKDKELVIEWQDGVRSVLSVSYLRTMCPCAQCKDVREAAAKKPKTSLMILPGNFVSHIVATGAERVGNYAIRIDWSDDHGSGIYSFQYLREISPPAKN